MTIEIASQATGHLARSKLLWGMNTTSTSGYALIDTE